MKTPFKHLIGLLTCAVIVSAIGVSFAVASGVGFISKEELKPLIGNDGVVILDARRGRDWSSSEFKIKGALRAAPDDFSQWSSNYPKTKKIVLYCAWPDEYTSASLARKLIANGYPNVHALKGGWREWFRAKFPVEDI